MKWLTLRLGVVSDSQDKDLAKLSWSDRHGNIDESDVIIQIDNKWLF